MDDPITSDQRKLGPSAAPPGPARGVLSGLSSGHPGQPGAGADRFDVVMREVERLCARATIGGGVVPAAAHGEVAVGLRALLPLVDDEEFDQYLARLDRAAGFISSAEASEADDTSAYADAAWTAGIELSAFGADAEVLEAGDGSAVESSRTGVIEYWDFVLRRVVAELVGAAEPAAPFRPRVLADSRTA